ncbi:RNA polymerase sigma-70 factor (ECF subfamily) [Lewinella aquimaris]|uniref:RNA polymerase sigma-70 factor (ECF subfamily) n=1 Tax=Neolewinella aquimaris TaxID=1835722 RepID=A0A840E829_9BACT|nr:sigma-70 family RNA polymerase sigma factor [Neolewinella aquimaris]MBB4079765.1 RNA polymerase sigma-70 factor (ECF subfamily) [Neolewinella aquimaris]
MTTLTDTQILADIRSEDPAALRAVYVKYREPCLAFLRGRIIRQGDPNRDDLAVELFTDAMIIMVNNIRSGRLTELSARLDTYLNAVARNLYLKLKTRGREEYREANKLPTPLILPEYEIDGDEVRRILYARVRELGNRCRQLLSHFYFLDLDWESIADILGYKNAASAKNNKAKCMVRLRTLYGLTRQKQSP